MKGIVLAGGRGSRLFPSTLAVSKQALPIFSKPMIYYPISLLMMAGIRDILIITTPEDRTCFQRLLGGGLQFGVRFTYQTQEQPRGLAEAFIIGAPFIENDASALVLGDNLMFGHNLQKTLQDAVRLNKAATIFACQVSDPERYGIVEMDGSRAISLEEKPKKPKSNLAVPGLYIYDNRAPLIAKTMEPSARGELEITDLNRVYLDADELNVVKLGRGTAWLDAGTNESLLQASNFVAAIEERQGLMIACLEEVGLQQGWLNRENLAQSAVKHRGSSYGDYLVRLLEVGV